MMIMVVMVCVGQAESGISSLVTMRRNSGSSATGLARGPRAGRGGREATIAGVGRRVRNLRGRGVAGVAWAPPVRPRAPHLAIPPPL
ncbi:unnamed protein product [Pieris brassicae]|uniref:Uncharacterized protein n=1 Tax=Pieris brassicae TaxID=7116 RepID=A0A9P0XFB0_PIEBR|nr:unnamed protein product [Pieris brassicae]